MSNIYLNPKQIALLQDVLSAEIERLKQTIQSDELPQEVNDELSTQIDDLQTIQESFVS